MVLLPDINNVFVKFSFFLLSLVHQLLFIIHSSSIKSDYSN